MKRRKFIQLSSKGSIAVSALSFCNGLSLASPAMSAAETNALHLDEMKDWQIIVSEEAIPSEKYAAEEFHRLFKAITATELAITTKIETPTEIETTTKIAGKHAIYIGKAALHHGSSLRSAVSTLGEEGLHIHIAKELLLIAGGGQRGTLYGVYEFFERYVGLRFLTADHTYIPRNAAAVSIPVLDFSYAPPFDFRSSYYKENFDNPSFATRLRINTITEDPRLGGKTSQELITHSILNYLPISVYGKSHPEYYALVDGVRNLQVGGGPQVCSTNADVIRIVSDGIADALAANPALTSISVSQMDNNSFCECSACSALSDKEESHGAPHLALVNAIAEKIAITHPGVKIGTLVYRYSRKPPKTIRLLPNVEIMLCSFECCILHSLDDPHCSRNKLFMEDFYKWRNSCSNILIWNYNTNFNAYDLPFPNFNVIAKNVQLFQDNNARGVFMQAAGNGSSTEMSDLRNYVMARCLWHPMEESWQLVNEFCHLHYGDAAKPIVSYLHFLHDNAERRGVHPNCFPKPSEVGLDLAAARQINSFFSEALQLAGDPITRLRVEKATIPALRAIFATAPIIHKDGLYKYDAAIVDGKRLDDYTHLTQKFAMGRVGETKPTSAYVKELFALKEGVTAVILENETWRILILPMQLGRIAELFYKPLAKNLIIEPGAEEIGIDSPPHTKCTWRRSKNAVIVSALSGDGSTWEREISFSDDQREIRIRAEYTAGVDKQEFEIRERPCMYRIAGIADAEIVSAYSKELVWRQGNQHWQFDMAMVVKQLIHTGANCTSLAFYDHSQELGMQQDFDQDTFRSFFLYWYPGRKEMGMEMRLPVKTMRKGQKLGFGYTLKFLGQAPWKAGAI
jgi:hypothetical protein